MSSSKSYSQIGQDLFLLSYYNNRRNGFFIELGAGDGKNLSNTLLLEEDYGWNGVCIEPNSFFHSDLKNNRKCFIDHSLCYSESGKEVDFVPHHLLGGIKENIKCHTHVLQTPSYKMVTNTLGNVLDKINAPTFIDYLSLDTEGSELEILKGVDMEKYKFGFISIEHNFVEPERKNIRNFLEERGYRFLRENKFDDDYVYIREEKEEMNILDRHKGEQSSLDCALVENPSLTPCDTVVENPSLTPCDTVVENPSFNS